MNQMHESNRHHWNETAASWKRLRDDDGLWRRCPIEPHLAFDGKALETIQDLFADRCGLSVCCIGSGDNYAAFALAGMGAQVTSVDISERQLAVAAERADELCLSITFLQADAASLGQIKEAAFDLVCSTNGFFVWISDLESVFVQVHRLLKPGGFYVFYDIHPFMRPWKEQVRPIEMLKSYWETGPFKDDGTYQFNWTMADILNSLARSGLVLHRLMESPARDSRFWEGYSYGPGPCPSLLDWRLNPRAGLPVWLTVAAKKP